MLTGYYDRRKVLLMDIYCPKCGEPLDNDCLHDEADEQGISYAEVAANFRAKGCEALTVYGNGEPCVPTGSYRAAAMDALYDLLGDDMDGAASMMEDAEMMGMFR